MNLTERRLLDLLKKMRDEDDVYAVKAEFEAEGTRADELAMLCEIVYRADMKLVVKIGGCEAVNDIDRCRTIGASAVMAPMIESPFAMTKFVKAGQRVYGDRSGDIEWIINIETATAYQNLDAILAAGKGFVNAITVGRDDLSSSLQIPKTELNGEEMYRITSDILDRGRAAGYIGNFGGGISSFEAIPFIQRMRGHNDRVETRKIIFKAQSDDKILRSGITDSIEFEMLYLQNKCDYYRGMADEDADRLQMMKNRLEIARQQMR